MLEAGPEFRVPAQQGATVGSQHPLPRKAADMLNPLPLDELTAVFARIKGLLLTEEKVDRAVQLLVQAVSEAIPGTVGAGISLLDARGQGTSIGATSAAVRLADDAQHGLGQGPCVTAWTAGRTVQGNDDEWAASWPDWSEAAAALQLRSAVSAPLLTDGTPAGTLKIYGSQPHAFAAGTAALLEKFAVPAAILLVHIQGPDVPRRLSGPLKGALIGRDTTNRACGVLMERHGLSAEESFQELMRRARSARVSLSEVCAGIIGGRRRHGSLSPRGTRGTRAVAVHAAGTARVSAFWPSPR